MRIFYLVIKSCKAFFFQFAYSVVSFLPNDHMSCRLRVFLLKVLGFNLHLKCKIFSNVLLIGNVEIGKNSSVSNNSVLSGADAGIVIKENVMIAPGVCIIAFDHGSDPGIPMVDQKLVQEKVLICDDVWIGANSTITKGVVIGRGAIIGANSVVTRSIPEFAVAAGCPAKVIKERIRTNNV